MQNPGSILIVDDEPNIRFIIERTLQGDGYQIDTAASGKEAIEKQKVNTYDLILLDLHMEPGGGMDVFNSCRAAGVDTIVIILTAHGSLDSAVEALRLGAFDYLFKPASPDTIRQRVREGLEYRRKTLRMNHLLSQFNQLRQMISELETTSNDETLTPGQRFLFSGPVKLDRQRRSALLNDRLLDLTTAEFNFLLCLIEKSPLPASHCELIVAALGYSCEEFEARELTKWHIHNLRKKVESNPEQPRYIKTVRHQGYLWCG
jgi:DNA-binding response OmpR family regulator